MGIGSIEFNGSVSRVQDFQQQKVNEENKVYVDHNNFQQKIDKRIKDSYEQVNQYEDTDKSDNKFDAKEKGKNKYFKEKKNYNKDGKKKELTSLDNDDEKSTFDIKI